MNAWKIVGLVCLVLVLLVLAWVGRLLWWASNAKPGASVDYAAKLEALAASSQAADSRTGDGFALLAAAAKSFRESREAFNAKASGALTKAPADWPQGFDWPTDFGLLRVPTVDEKAAARTREFMQNTAASGIYDSLEQIARSRAGVRTYSHRTMLVLEELPYLAQSRVLVRMNCARMRLAHDAGDGAELVRAFESNLAIGRVIASQSTTIERLVGIAAVAAADEELREDLVFRPVGAQTTRELLAALDRQLPISGVEVTIEAERLSCLDTIQWTHSDDGRGDGFLLAGQLDRFGSLAGGAPLSPVPGGVFGNAMTRVIFPTKKVTTARANAIFDHAVAIGKLPVGQRDLGSLDVEIENLPRTQLLLKMTMPAMGSLVRNSEQFDTRVAALRTMLGIELYRAEKGDYPASLAELVPAALPELPKDVWAADGKFRYLKPAPDGVRPYLLYSVGVDRTDDGGKEHPSNASLPISGSREGFGYDYVVNRERKKPE